MAVSFNWAWIDTCFEDWRSVEIDTIREDKNKKQLILTLIRGGHRAREVGRLVEKLESLVFSF